MSRPSSSQSSTAVLAVANGAPSHEPASRAIDLREIVRILRRHSRIIVVTSIIVVALSLVFVSVVGPVYTATSTVLIDPRRTNVIDTNNQAVSSSFGSDDAVTESQALLIQSVSLLQLVVERLKLADDPEFAPPPGIVDTIKALFASSESAPGASPEEIGKAKAVERLQKRLKVVRQRTTFLIDINASSHEPAKAAAIANAVAEAYFLEQVRSKYDATKAAADWLNQQIEALKARVLATDKAVEDFRAGNNLIASQGVTVNDQQITDLNNKLIEARVQTAEAYAKYDQVQRIADSGRDPGSVAEALSSDTIVRLRAQYADLAKNGADLASKYGARHPAMATVRAQLHDTQRLINEEVQRILQSRRHTYEVAAAREASLQRSLDELQGVSTDSGQAQIRLRELQREAEANRTLYESFLARYKEASARESLEMPEARIVTKAEAPLRPSFPKISLLLGLALLLGPSLGSVFALAVDYFDRRIKTLEQATAISELPGLAAIPLVGSRELARLAKRGRAELERYDPRTARLLPPALQPALMRYAIEEPTSMFAEAVRAIRLALQRATRSKTGQIVMVTSALGGEGKTTLAANLALSLAVIGARTVLVECDLRNPEMTRSLCPRAPLGLLDVATGRAPLHQAVLVEQVTSLSILPCPLTKNTADVSEFVFSGGLGAIFDALRQHYDMIVVDSPPLMPLADGQAIAEHADSIVLAVGWDRTPRDVFARSLDLLAPVYDRILGVVLTGVDLRRARFYGHYGSYAYLGSYGYGMRPEAAE
jgi:succinoglycan biosynthesis transport protein ExoP